MKTLLLASAATLFVPTAAFAAEAEAAEGEQIVVTGHADGYKATDSVTATKTDTPLLDVPQTVTVITRERLDDQAQRSMAEVLRYVPGTTVGQGEGNRDQVTLRGQNTTADFFLDGVRDDVQYYRSLYNIERVEVLKGPFALIFGRGGSGGIINRVQKTPTADELRLRGNASVNTFGAWNIAGDINLPLSASAAFRINADYEKLDSHRDFVDGERFAVNPYFAADLGDWHLGLSYEYVHDDRVPDRGVPSVATGTGLPNTPLTGYRDAFFGVPGVNRAGLEAHIAKLRLDGELAENLNWSTTLLYGDYDKYYTNVFANGAVSATGTVALAAYTDTTQRQNFIASSNLVWDVDLGSVGNKILLGVEYGNQDTEGFRRTGLLSNANVSLSAIVYPTVTFTTLSRDSSSNVEFFSVYAQDQISFGPYLDLVVGLRYDRFEITGSDRLTTPARPFARTDEEVSPRIGLIVKPQENVSLYASFSKSFLPRSGEQFLTLSTINESLEPERITNYEVGAKWDISSSFGLTLGLFQLDRTNTGVPDPNVPGQQFLTDTRTKGVEFGLAGRITPEWQISGGYTYQDAFRKNDASIRLGQVPKHQLALWNRYDVNDQFGLGLGVVHQSSQYAAIRTAATTTLLPAFTRVDAALFFKASSGLEFQINVENLLDEQYFSDAHNNNNISTGAPFNARFTVRMKF